VQAAAAPEENVPRGQSIGDWSAKGQYWPEGQSVHVSSPSSEYWPAVHGTGRAVTEAHENPAGHGVHEVCPELYAIFGREHAEQSPTSVRPVSEPPVPTGHGVGWFEPAVQ